MTAEKFKNLSMIGEGYHIAAEDQADQWQTPVSTIKENATIKPGQRTHALALETIALCPLLLFSMDTSV